MPSSSPFTALEWDVVSEALRVYEIETRRLIRLEPTSEAYQDRLEHIISAQGAIGFDRPR